MKAGSKKPASAKGGVKPSARNSKPLTKGAKTSSDRKTNTARKTTSRANTRTGKSSVVSRVQKSLKGR